MQTPIRRLSFSGAGFLGAFHLGAGEALVRGGAIHQSTEIAGASAGALIGAVLVTGIPSTVARSALASLCHSTRAAPLGVLTPGLSLVDQLRSLFYEHLPSDAHHMSSGRLHVALTSLKRGESGRVSFTSEFTSRDHLIDCVTASSDIPGVTGLFRPPPGVAAAAGVEAGLLQRLTGRDFVDGGLMDIFPDPWVDDPRAPRTLFVSPFAGNGLPIAPPPRADAWRVPSYSPIGASQQGRELELTRENLHRWVHAFFPPPPEVLEQYEQAGSKAAIAWLSQQKSSPSSRLSPSE